MKVRAFKQHLVVSWDPVPNAVEASIFIGILLAEQFLLL